MITVSNHFRERYAERIKGITDIATRNSYAYQNADMILEWATKMLEYGDTFYSGTVGNKYADRKYVRCGEYILVQNPVDEVLITIFEIGFGFDVNNNKEISRIMASEINTLQNEIELAEVVSLEINEQVNDEIALIDLQIEQLKRTLELLEADKEALKVKAKRSKFDVNEKLNKLEQLFIRVLSKGFGEEIKKK